MASNERLTSRRKLLASAGSATAFGLAGCVGGDDGTGTDGSENSGSGGSDPDASGTDDSDDSGTAVTLLVEAVGGSHDDNHADEHGQRHDYAHEGLTDEEIGHSCVHLEEVEEFGAEVIAAGASVEEAPHLDDVHHPYRITLEGGTGYLLFEMDGGHNHDRSGDANEEEADLDGDEDDEGTNESGELLVFFTEGGSTDVVKGDPVYVETEPVDRCDPIDRYTVAEPDHGEVVVELSADT